jgi:hypothetical protein
MGSDGVDGFALGGFLICSPITIRSGPDVFNPRSPRWRSDKATLSSLASALFPLYKISALKKADSVKSATRPSAASTNLKTKTETQEEVNVCEDTPGQRKLNVHQF